MDDLKLSRRLVRKRKSLGFILFPEPVRGQNGIKKVIYSGVTQLVRVPS